MRAVVFRAAFCRGMAGLLAVWALRASGSGNGDWIIRAWHTDDGLPDNAVTGVAQAEDGYLWVATRGGLARFDGIGFARFPLLDFSLTNSALAVPSEEAAGLLRSRSGGLWLPIVSGPLALLKSGTAQLIKNPLTNSPTATGMLEDDANGLLVHYGPRIFRVAGGQTEEFPRDELPVGNCRSLAKDSQGRMWLAKGSQVGLFQSNRFETLFQLGTASLRLASARHGGIWICADRRLLACSEDGGLREVGTFRAKTSRMDPTIMLEGRDGTIWIGTAGDGLIHFGSGDFERVPTTHSTILCLAEDREGNIWAGTDGGGLNEVRPRTIRLEGNETGVASKIVRAICEDGRGQLWGVSQSGLLLMRTNEEWLPVSDSPGWPQVTVTCLTADPEGTLWLGTINRRLMCLRDGVITTWGDMSAITNRIGAVLADSRNNIWIREDSAPYGMLCICSNQLQRAPLPQSRARGIQAMAEDVAGNLWFGANDGRIYSVRDGTSRLESATAPVHSAVRCLTATRDGSLWIGYKDAGVGRLKEGHFALIGRDQGLYDDDILQIVDDGRGSLWFGSGRGIFRVQREMLDAVAEGRRAEVGSVHYGPGEGVPELHFNPENAGGGVRSRDGRLWMPVGTYLAIINPENARDETTPPSVLLTRIVADGRTVASYRGGIMPGRNVIAMEQRGASLNLPPQHHRLDFDFTTLNFAAPENASFRYTLEGLDAGWSKAGPERSATYSRLSPGNYRIRVMACNSSGMWNETPASFGFAVLPFVWQQWWFRLAGVSVFTAVALSTGRYLAHRRLRHRLLKLEQQVALDTERTRIARDLHDDLGSCLTEIIMVSGLSQRRRIPTEQAIKEVQAAARHAIKALDQTVWAVNPQNDTVPAFINYTSQFVVEFLRTAGIKCDTDIPEQLPQQTMRAEARHNLFLVIKEAINNIARHAKASEVLFQVVVSNGSLGFCIRDNGQGFKAGSAGPDADGLRNMRQRVAEIGGEFRIESPPGAGTRIDFSCKVSSPV